MKGADGIDVGREGSAARKQFSEDNSILFLIDLTLNCQVIENKFGRGTHDVQSEVQGTELESFV